MKKTFGLALSAGFLAVSAGTANGAVGMAFGIDGTPENAGIEFFAACLVLCLAIFLLTLFLLKRLHRPRLIPGGMIPFLPFSASFHLADSGVTIGNRKSVPQRERDGGITFRPFSFP